MPSLREAGRPAAELGGRVAGRRQRLEKRPDQALTSAATHARTGQALLGLEALGLGWEWESGWKSALLSPPPRPAPWGSPSSRVTDCSP